MYWGSGTAVGKIMSHPAQGEQNLYETVHDILCHFLTISNEEAKHIPLVNAHRLPPANRNDSSSERQPPAVIIRFACMMDRRARARASVSSLHPREAAVIQLRPPSAASQYGRIFPEDEARKGAASIDSLQYSEKQQSLDQNQDCWHTWIAGTHVLLQTRNIVRNGGTP